jgi:hypothetical protein
MQNLRFFPKTHIYATFQTWLTRHRVKMLRDRYRQWGINDKNRRTTPQEVCYSTVAAVYGDAVCCHGDQHLDGGIRHNASSAYVSPQPPLSVSNQARLLHQALKSLHTGSYNSMS